MTEKSKYGLLDLKVYKENDNLVKKIETQFCDTIGVKRVNAPVPDYSNNDSGEFHYVSTERIANGDLCEKFSLKKANVLSDARKTNDFCPRAQLNKLLECCGKPELSR